MLESLITSKTKRKLLALLFGNPEKEFYLRELARRISEPTNAVSRELEKLERAGLLIKERKANLLYFQANKKSQIYGELKAMILKTEGAGTALREELGKIGKVRFAFIYGSTARGEERAGSDIDLMIIGKPELKKIVSFASKTEKKIGREINYLIYPESEFLKSLERGFIQEVIRGKKIMLVGEKSELERFIEGGKGKKSNSRREAGERVP